MNGLALPNLIKNPRKNAQSLKSPRSRDVDYVCIEAGLLGNMLAELQTLKDNNGQLTLAMAIAGHDLRQRLHSLLGTIELLKLSKSAERTAELSQRAKSIAQRLVGELGRLALGTRSDPVTRTPVASCFAIASLSEQLRADWEDEATAKRLRFSVDSGNYSVESNQRLLASIMDNLVGNAVRHTQDGAITVAVTREGRYLIWTVTDTGPGISENALRQSLSIAPCLEASGAGMGLGLSIARKTAEILGHALVIDTAPNRGTSIRLEVPLAIEHASVLIV